MLAVSPLGEEEGHKGSACLSLDSTLGLTELLAIHAQHTQTHTHTISSCRSSALLYRFAYRIVLQIKTYIH